MMPMQETAESIIEPMVLFQHSFVSTPDSSNQYLHSPQFITDSNGLADWKNQVSSQNDSYRLPNI